MYEEFSDFSKSVIPMYLLIIFVSNYLWNYGESIEHDGGILGSGGAAFFSPMGYVSLISDDMIEFSVSTSLSTIGSQMEEIRTQNQTAYPELMSVLEKIMVLYHFYRSDDAFDSGQRPGVPANHLMYNPRSQWKATFDIEWRMTSLGEVVTCINDDSCANSTTNLQRKISLAIEEAKTFIDDFYQALLFNKVPASMILPEKIFEKLKVVKKELGTDFVFPLNGEFFKLYLQVMSCEMVLILEQKVLFILRVPVKAVMLEKNDSVFPFRLYSISSLGIVDDLNNTIDVVIEYNFIIVHHKLMYYTHLRDMTHCNRVGRYFFTCVLIANLRPYNELVTPRATCEAFMIYNKLDTVWSPNCEFVRRKKPLGIGFIRSKKLTCFPLSVYPRLDNFHLRCTQMGATDPASYKFAHQFLEPSKCFVTERNCSLIDPGHGFIFPLPLGHFSAHKRGHLHVSYVGSRLSNPIIIDKNRDMSCQNKEDFCSEQAPGSTDFYIFLSILLVSCMAFTITIYINYYWFSLKVEAMNGEVNDLKVELNRELNNIHQRREALNNSSIPPSSPITRPRPSPPSNPPPHHHPSHLGTIPRHQRETRHPRQMTGRGGINIIPLSSHPGVFSSEPASVTFSTHSSSTQMHNRVYDNDTINNSPLVEGDNDGYMTLTGRR